MAHPSGSKEEGGEPAKPRQFTPQSFRDNEKQFTRVRYRGQDVACTARDVKDVINKYDGI